MNWLEENFYEFFQIYWRGSDYSKTKTNRALLDFSATNFSSDALTVEFEVLFYGDDYE